MKSPRPHPRLASTALLAAAVLLVGMAGGASARSTAPKPCCVGPGTSARCCCSAIPAARPEPTPVPAAIGRLDQPTVVAADRSCECRSDRPGDPASRPEPSPTSRRADRGRWDSFEASFRPDIASKASRSIPPTASPPRIEVHLLTVRLLI